VVAAPAAAVIIAATTASFEASFEKSAFLKNPVGTSPQFPGARARELDLVGNKVRLKRGKETTQSNLLSNQEPLRLSRW
jgi:hypothetical protein